MGGPGLTAISDVSRQGKGSQASKLQTRELLLRDALIEPDALRTPKKKTL